jgi:hypothetical protein
MKPALQRISPMQNLSAKPGLTQKGYSSARERLIEAGRASRLRAFSDWSADSYVRQVFTKREFVEGGRDLKFARTWLSALRRISETPASRRRP